jgi:hypothetical protein
MLSETVFLLPSVSLHQSEQTISAIPDTKYFCHVNEKKSVPIQQNGIRIFYKFIIYDSCVKNSSYTSCFHHQGLSSFCLLWFQIYVIIKITFKDPRNITAGFVVFRTLLRYTLYLIPDGNRKLEHL